jgi:hypothetical protein
MFYIMFDCYHLKQAWPHSGPEHYLCYQAWAGAVLYTRESSLSEWSATICIKPGLGKYDQLMSYCFFNKSPWIGEIHILFFHLFYLVIVDSEIVYGKKSDEKLWLQQFYEKITERLLGDMETNDCEICYHCEQTCGTR